MNNIQTLNEVENVLESLGYEVKNENDAIMLKIGSQENPFVATVTKSEEGNSLSFTCQLARLKDVAELDKFMFAALDVNTRILPYAVGILSSNDNHELDNEDEWPVVLINSVPLGDLSEMEVEASMNSMLNSLLTCSAELKQLLK